MIAHLINTDVGGRGVGRLYLDYRRRDFNFLHNSAKLFLDNYGKVLIVTGFPIPPMNVPETDGPPGALALYRAVRELGGEAEILAQEEVINAMIPFQKALSLRFAGEPDVSSYDLVIFVETPGKAQDGNHYSMSGLPVVGETFDWVVEDAKEHGVPTIGIGDGGNEIGMGKVRDLVVRYVPHGEKIASTIETDELILSAVSNWGAYGLIAQASLELGKNLLSGWEEAFVVRLLVESGLIDGVSKKREVSVDGIPIEVHVAFVKFLNGIVEFNLSKV
ncbi:putative D-glutamate cyclase [Thermococcus nautili]|uniref:DUF4392 domain-containing protein n=1 Tax=Thermococcus nautili TaxID=195522 RepID=UPI002556AC39|nr:glutamate cyclase domain-containing protein [Thermococcus nautili]CAI1494107.1 putative D-glutamate cyclase [Thermococcus nautili]